LIFYEDFEVNGSIVYEINSCLSVINSQLKMFLILSLNEILGFKQHFLDIFWQITDLLLCICVQLTVQNSFILQMVFCLLWFCEACEYFIEGVLANIVEIWCFIVYLRRVFFKTILLYYQFIFFLFVLMNINFNIFLLFIFILKNLKILIKFCVFIFQGSFIFSHLFSIIWFTFLFINIFIFKSKS